MTTLDLPPRPPACIPIHTSHLSQHPDEILVPGFGSALYERPTLFHRVVEVGEQFVSSRGSEAVHVGYQAKTARLIDGTPAKALSTSFIVDRHAHPSERGQIVNGSAGGREVEVQQSNGVTTAEDHVLETDIVVAHDTPAGGIG